MNVAQFRQQYPQFDAYTDQELLDAYARQLGMDSRHPRFKELESQFLGQDRTWSEAIGDTVLGVGQGLTAVGEFGGMLAGAITPGVSAFDNPITNTMSEWGGALGERMSPGMQARQAEAARNVQIAEQRALAEGRSEFAAGLGAQAMNYVRNPSMAVHDTIATAPTMLAGGPVGRGVQLGLRAVGAGARGATRAGVGAAIGTTSAMQGYEAAQDVYESLREQGVGHEEATREATRALATSGAVSAGLSMLPYGATIERSMIPGAARRGAGGRLRSAGRAAAGEGATEALDEGFAQYTGNVFVMPYDETRTEWAGVGQAAVQGGVAGVGLGAPASVFSRRPQARTETGDVNLLNKDVPGGEAPLMLGQDPAPLQLGYDPSVGNRIEHDPSADPGGGPTLPGRVVFRGNEAFYVEGEPGEETNWIELPIAPDQVQFYLDATRTPPESAPVEDEPTFVDIAGPVIDPNQRTEPTFLDLYAEPDPSPYDVPGQGLRTSPPVAPAPAADESLLTREILELQLENIRDRDDANRGELDADTARTRIQQRYERINEIEAQLRVERPAQPAQEAPVVEPIPPVQQEQVLEPEAPAADADADATDTITRGRLLETLRRAEQETGVTRSAILRSGERVRANAPTMIRSIMSDADPVAAMEAMHRSGELTEAQTRLVEAWYTALTGQPIAPQGQAETGFVPEPDPQVRAQIDALREGRRTVVIMDTQQAARLSQALEGLEQAVARDPNTGEQATVVSTDAATVQGAITRTSEVGLRQAMGEAMQVVDPTQTTAPSPDAVVVQQVDDATGQPIADEVVPASRVDEVAPIEGTTPRILAPDQVLEERRAGAEPAPAAPVNTVNQAEPAETVADPELEAQDAALPVVDGRSSTEDFITVADNAVGEELYDYARYTLYKRWEDRGDEAAEAYLTTPENQLTDDERQRFDQRLAEEKARARAKRGGKKKTKQGQEIEPAVLAEIEAVAEQPAPEPVNTVNQAEPAPASEAVEEVPQWVSNHANDVNGEVVYVGDGIALIVGHSVLSGELVYAGVSETAGRTRVDIDRYTGKGFSADQLKTLRDKKKEHATEERRRQREAPDGPFLGGSNMAVSESVDPRLGLLLDSLLKALNLDGVRVFLLHPHDVRGNRDAYNLHGQYASAASAGMDANENGSTRRFGPRKGDHYISLDPNLSPERAIETLAHELGHIVEKTALANATPAVKKQIKKAYEQWLQETKGMTAPQIIGALRNAATAQAHMEGVSDDVQLSPYWTSFSEWFADNVSKWVTTARKPSTLVDRFFERVATQLRKLAAALGGKRYVPNPEVAKFLDAMAEQGNPDLAAILNEPAGADPDGGNQSRRPGVMDSPMMRPTGVSRAPAAPREPSASTPTPEPPVPLTGVAAALKRAYRRVTPGRHTVSKIVLKGLSLRQIRDQYGHILPGARGWIEATLERSGMASNIATEANSVEKVWSSLSKADSQALSEVLLGATVAEIYLDNNTKEYLDSLTDEQRAEHARLNAIKLSDTAKKVRRDALAVLQRQWDYTHQSITKLLNHTIRDADVRRSEIAKLDAIFNERRGDYFPLSRFGTQVVIGRNAAADGGDVVTFHETTASAEAERDRLRAEGIESVVVNELTARDPRERASTGFVGDLHRAVEQAGITDAGIKEGLHQAIQQLYMQSLPEISGAKRMIRRRNIEGFSRNARRGFADAVAKGSRYAAQLDFAPRIQAAQETAENQTRSAERQSVSVVIGRRAGSPARVRVVPAGTPRYDAAEELMADGYTVSHHNATPAGIREFIAGTLPGATTEQLDRFQARAEALSSEKTGVQDLRQATVVYNHLKNLQAQAARFEPHPVSEFLGVAGYIWFLGATPAFMFMNMMQNPIIGLPVLGAKFGTTRTMLEWGKQARWFSGVRINKLLAEGKQPFNIAWLRQQVADGVVTGLNKDQLDMLQRLEDMQLIDFTQHRDLSNVGRASSTAWQKGAHLASAGAHHVEVFNRVTAALTAYNLAMQSDPNLTPKQATRVAEDAVAAIHFDYSPGNKPQVMRGNVMRPLMMFQQYRQHLLYWWANDIKEALKGETPKVRAEARKAAFLMGATNALFAGALGMPFVGTIQFLANLLGPDGEDGEEFDFEKWVTEAANEAEAATGVGGLSAVLTKGIFAAMGMNIGQRLSQADLIPFLSEGSARFEREAGNKARAYLFDLLGPVGSVAVDMVRSTEAFERGDVVAGLAQATPKAIADGLRAWQMSTEGIKNRRGEILATAEAFDGYDVLLQATGIMPTTAADIRADRGRIYEMEQQFQRRTSQLTNNFVEAWQRQDQHGMLEATRNIQEYNRKVASGRFGEHPELLQRLVLDGRRIEQAIRRRQQQAYLRALSGGRADTQRQMLLGMQMSGLIQQITPQMVADNASVLIEHN